MDVVEVPIKTEKNRLGSVSQMGPDRGNRGEANADPGGLVTVNSYVN